MENLRNLGGSNAAWRREVGVYTSSDLQRLGPVVVFQLVRPSRPDTSLNLLWAIAAALRGAVRGREFLSINNVTLTLGIGVYTFFMLLFFERLYQRASEPRQIAAEQRQLVAWGKDCELSEQFAAPGIEAHNPAAPIWRLRRQIGARDFAELITWGYINARQSSVVSPQATCLHRYAVNCVDTTALGRVGAAWEGAIGGRGGCHRSNDPPKNRETNPPVRSFLARDPPKGPKGG